MPTKLSVCEVFYLAAKSEKVLSGINNLRRLDDCRVYFLVKTFHRPELELLNKFLDRHSYHSISPFFSYIATPVTVPSRRRGFSECSRGIRSPMDSLSSSPRSDTYHHTYGSSNEEHKYLANRGNVWITEVMFDWERNIWIGEVMLASLTWK